MASKNVIALIDDLHGGQAAETVVFSLDGLSYEIDLSEQNAELMRDALDEFVDAARRVTRAPIAAWNAAERRMSRHTQWPHQRPERLTRHDAHQIREWAARQSIIVQPRGRLPEDAINAYYTQRSLRSPAIGAAPLTTTGECDAVRPTASVMRTDIHRSATESLPD